MITYVIVNTVVVLATCGSLRFGVANSVNSNMNSATQKTLLPVFLKIPSQTFRFRNPVKTFTGKGRRLSEMTSKVDPVS